VKLGDVLPESALANELDGHGRHAVLRSQRLGALTRSEARPDGAHGIFGQLGSRGPFALTRRAALLLGHVGHVVGVRSEAQVAWVAARRIVATVQNVKAIRNRTMRVRVGKAMGGNLVPAVASTEPAIAAGLVFRSGPRPACALSNGTVDAPPEHLTGSKAPSLLDSHARSLS
jgi:hypothetical protein